MSSMGNQVRGKSLYGLYLPDLTQPRFTNMSKQNAREYAEDFKQNGKPPWLHALWMHWKELFDEPYKGITTDGKIISDLFYLQEEGMPIEAITSAANSLLSLLSPIQTNLLTYHIDFPEWRSWSNPEFLLSDKGLRLENVSPAIRAAIMSILQTTLSPEGYAKAVSAMRINAHLGDLCACPTICNESSYNFVLFGRPLHHLPWGISFYGHHLCLNIFLYKTQVVISPWFTGAEPNLITNGPHAGTSILQVEESLGLRLMQSLSPAHRAIAQLYPTMHDPAMPPGRWNRDDQRHLCGAFRDNRIIPTEGLSATLLTTVQTNLLLSILTQYLLYLPCKPGR